MSWSDDTSWAGDDSNRNSGSVHAQACNSSQVARAAGMKGVWQRGAQAEVCREQRRVGGTQGTVIGVERWWHGGVPASRPWR